MAQVKDKIHDWSIVPADNWPKGVDQIGTGLDDNLREIQKVVKEQFSTGSVAAAATTDLSLVNNRQVLVTGTGQTITSFGTLEAGAYKIVTFADENTITHSSPTIILPNEENFITQLGDMLIMYSNGSGNWECISYYRRSGPWESPGANKVRQDIANLDNATKDGIYEYQNTATNAPVDADSNPGDGILIVHNEIGGNIHQFAFSSYQTGGGMWFRRYAAAAWGAWERVALAAEVAADLSSAISTHESDTSTHGVTGAILGTEDIHYSGAEKLMGAKASVSNANCNTLMGAGCYRLSTGVTNGPAGNPSYMTLATFRGPSSDTAAQLAWLYTSSTMYFRSDNGASDSNWSVSNPWRQVIHDGGGQTINGTLTTSRGGVPGANFAKITASSSAPSSPSVNDIWIDF